jgi:hypothetical protein
MFTDWMVILHRLKMTVAKTIISCSRAQKAWARSWQPEPILGIGAWAQTTCSSPFWDGHMLIILCMLSCPTGVGHCWACTQCLVEGLGTSAPPYTRACTRAQHARDQERFSSLICLGLSSVPEPISHFKWARAQHPSKIFSGFHTSPLVFHIDLILIILSRIQLRIS